MQSGSAFRQRWQKERAEELAALLSYSGWTHDNPITPKEAHGGSNDVSRREAGRARSTSAAASSYGAAKLRAVASSTANSPSLTRGCSIGGRLEVGL